MHRPPALGRRRRLALRFAFVAGLAAGVLAAGSYFLVWEGRLRDSLARAEAQARFGLRQAVELPTKPPELRAFVRTYEEERGLRVVLLAGGRTFGSVRSPSIEIPGDLRTLVSGGWLGYERVGVGGVAYLIVGGPAPGSDQQLYFFFSEAGIARDLAQLRNVLLLGWAAVVAVAFVFGRGAELRIAALSAAEARERRFTSDVAHELRTPLSGLVAEASALADHLDRLPSEARRPAELLVADVARLRRLVEDLMEISRLDARSEEVLAEPVDLAALVSAVIRNRGWEGRVTLLVDPVPIASDRRRLERIVSNLVENAVEHGGREVIVRVGRDGAEVFVEVADRGPGIPLEHLPHVFDRFYKADPSRTGRGSGLGLAIARENARLLGGDVNASSEVGAGTTFALRLIVTEPLPGRDGSVSSPSDDGGGAGEAGP